MAQQIPEELIEAGRGYETLFVPALFEPWTTHLVEAAAIGPGMQVLDVACGTGVLARRVLAETGPSGGVTGLDPAPGMLAVAEEIEPTVDWRLCGAESMDLNDEAFDAVVSQFGLMFVEDRQKAADEMRRVLKAGGSLAVAVWDSVGQNPAYADLIDLLEQEVSAAAADALRLPFCLGEPDDVTAIFAQSGFTDLGVDTRVEQARFPSTRHMVEAELRGWLPLFGIHLEESAIADVLAASDRRLRRYKADSGEAVFPTSAHIVTARRPRQRQAPAGISG